MTPRARARRDRSRIRTLPGARLGVSTSTSSRAETEELRAVDSHHDRGEVGEEEAHRVSRAAIVPPPRSASTCQLVGHSHVAPPSSDRASASPAQSHVTLPPDATATSPPATVAAKQAPGRAGREPSLGDGHADEPRAGASVLIEHHDAVAALARADRSCARYGGRSEPYRAAIDVACTDPSSQSTAAEFSSITASCTTTAQGAARSPAGACTPARLAGSTNHEAPSSSGAASHAAPPVKDRA